MKALSLKQPWATLIVAGTKPIENRTWASNYRGPLLIHASKTWDEDGACWIIHHFPELTGLIRHSKHIKGAIIGKVKMTDCVSEFNSKWFFGPYGFVLTKPKLFDKPIPYKGQLGIFDIPDEVIFRTE